MVPRLHRPHRLHPGLARPGLYVLPHVALSHLPLLTPVCSSDPPDMTLTIKRIGFSTFDTNMLTIPSAILQIITMLALSYSSDYFKERTLYVACS